MNIAEIVVIFFVVCLVGGCLLCCLPLGSSAGMLIIPVCIFCLLVAFGGRAWHG